MKLMKKLKLPIFICLLLTSVLLPTACNPQSKPKELATGKYVMQNETVEDWAWVLLKENYQFEFNRDMGTSYRPTGAYEVKDNELFLKADAATKYKFEISEDQLIFKGLVSESGEILDGIPEIGSVFKFKVNQ